MPGRMLELVVWAVAVLGCLCTVNGFQAYPKDCKLVKDAAALQLALRGDNNLNGRALCLEECASLRHTCLLPDLSDSLMQFLSISLVMCDCVRFKRLRQHLVGNGSRGLSFLHPAVRRAYGNVDASNAFTLHTWYVSVPGYLRFASFASDSELSARHSRNPLPRGLQWNGVQ